MGNMSKLGLIPSQSHQLSPWCFESSHMVLITAQTPQATYFTRNLNRHPRTETEVKITWKQDEIQERVNKQEPNTSEKIALDSPNTKLLKRNITKQHLKIPINKITKQINNRSPYLNSINSGRPCRLGSVELLSGLTLCATTVLKLLRVESFPSAQAFPLRDIST